VHFKACPWQPFVHTMVGAFRIVGGWLCPVVLVKKQEWLKSPMRQRSDWLGITTDMLVLSCLWRSRSDEWWVTGGLGVMARHGLR
jgi:hypothetical protein